MPFPRSKKIYDAPGLYEYAVQALGRRMRTVAELKELRALTGDENGAQRVAFTPTWIKAREWFRKKLEELPVELRVFRAGDRTVWTCSPSSF